MAIKRGQRRPPKETDYILPLEVKPIKTGSEGGVLGYSVRAPSEARRKGLHGYIGTPDGIPKSRKINPANQIIEITRELQKHGIHTPKITRRNNEQLTYEDAGKNIGEVISGLSRPNISKLNRNKVKQRIKKLLSAFARQLGEMHAAKYSHGHIASRNVTVKGSKVSIIDLKYAKKQNVDWTSTSSIFNAFIADYEHLINYRTLHFLTNGIGPRETFKFLKRMVSRYPASEQIKRRVFAEILHHFEGISPEPAIEYWNKIL
ncbi:MAG: hypothetical protein ABIH20_02995 [Candidatus Diapherotrites archaeon]